MSQMAVCHHGHHIEIEVLSGTLKSSKVIECPVCGLDVNVWSGDVRGVVAVPGRLKFTREIPASLRPGWAEDFINGSSIPPPV